MKYRNKIEFIFLFVLFLFFIMPINAYAYDIETYDVNIVVNENNTFDIIENISVYFNTNQHGIIRNIPLKNEIQREDGTISKNTAKIENIDVNEKYSSSKSKGYQSIKIGDPNYTLTGQKDYKISYTYNIGKDPSINYDEFYFNIIGPEWDNTIKNITFTIKMPKEFDEAKLGFSAGKIDSTDSSNVSYEVNGNIITGKYNGTLKPGEALTIRLELPEGYFIGASLNISIFSIVAIILSLLLTLVAFILWMKNGRDDLVIETVEFYPPMGYNSAELAFMYKGLASSEDIVSLLIYLANKGYIQITETTENNFYITKLKEYDGNNSNEALFIEGLFKSGNQVTIGELKDKFYKTLDEISGNINHKVNKEKIFDSTSLRNQTISLLLMLVVFLFITVKPVIEYGGTSLLLFALIPTGLGLLAIITSLFNKSNLKDRLIGIIAGLIFTGVGFFTAVLPAIMIDPTYLITYIIGLICIFVIGFFNSKMLKRTPFGNEILGKIEGFKNFLEVVEKNRLEMMVNAYPTYFYDILPYAYVLGVSDEWIEKFETITMRSPNWYNGNSHYDTRQFGRSMNSTMKSATNAMSSRPESKTNNNGSRSRSGGGRSGRGSGGGGGSAW